MMYHSFSLTFLHDIYEFFIQVVAAFVRIVIQTNKTWHQIIVNIKKLKKRGGKVRLTVSVLEIFPYIGMQNPIPIMG